MQVRAFERYIPLITDDCTSWKGSEHTLLKNIAVREPTITVNSRQKANQTRNRLCNADRSTNVRIMILTAYNIYG